MLKIIFTVSSPNANTQAVRESLAMYLEQFGDVGLADVIETDDQIKME